MAEGIAGSAGVWVLGTFALSLVVLIGVGIYASRLMDTVGDYVVVDSVRGDERPLHD